MAEDIKSKYLAWKKENPDKGDIVFCTDQDITIFTLQEVLKEVSASEVSEEEIQTNLNRITRSTFNKLLSGELEGKSFEGVLNALTAFLKQLDLRAGKPTERIELIEDLEKKTPDELDAFIMGRLRRGSAANN